MNEYYFIPTNSLNFNNILSSESISPPAFYIKRGYGFKRFEKVRANPLTNSILAYSAIPLFDVSKNDREEFAVNLAVPKDLLSSLVQTYDRKESKILQFDSPIYINWKNCFFVVNNEEEKKKLEASTERSLEVKHADLYLPRIKVLSKNPKVNKFDWRESILHDISDLKTINYKSLNKDQRLNKIKGFLYGWICGNLKEHLPEMTSVKRYFQEFINSFSGLMNELSVLTKKSKKTSISNQHIEKELNRLESIKEKIDTLLSVSEKEKISGLIKESFNIDDDWMKRSQLIRYKNSEITVYSILSSFTKEKQPEFKTVDDLLAQLLYQAEEFLYTPRPKLYNELEDNFSTVRVKVNQVIESSENQSIAIRNVKNVPFVIDENYSSFDSHIKDLTPDENNYLIKIIAELLSRLELSTSDEIAQQRQDIITGVATKLKERTTVGKPEKDFPGREYLVQLYKSLQTVGVGFKPGDTDNVSLQAFAYFLSRYSDMSKFQDFMEKNGFKQFSVGYAIWGAAYGYANISKLLLEPLKVNSDALDLIQEFIHEITYGKEQPNLVKERSPDSIEQDGNSDSVTTMEWDVSDKSDVKKESEDKKQRNGFRELLLENKKIGSNQDWVSYISECSEQALTKEFAEGSLLPIDEQRVDFFDETIKVNAKNMKGFGKAKIVEAVTLFKQYLQNNA